MNMTSLAEVSFGPRNSVDSHFKRFRRSDVGHNSVGVVKVHHSHQHGNLPSSLPPLPLELASTPGFLAPQPPGEGLIAIAKEATESMAACISTPTWHDLGIASFTPENEPIDTYSTSFTHPRINVHLPISPKKYECLSLLHGAKKLLVQPGSLLQALCQGRRILQRRAAALP